MHADSRLGCRTSCVQGPVKGATVTSENHEQVSSLLGAYVLGALDDLEHEKVRAHVTNCALCHREVDALRESVERLPPPQDLPDELWQRIVDEVKRRQ